MAVAVQVSIEELAERTGLWCDICNLPSRCEWDFATLFSGKPEFLWGFSCCADCDAEVITGEPFA